MTGRQEYDRTKDRQRTLDKYMVKISARKIKLPADSTLRYSICINNQTDQGDETEGLEGEGLEMKR